MSHRVYFPGFGLTPSMYTRLDPLASERGIDIVPSETFHETAASISTALNPGSIAVGYSLGARLALHCALEHPSLFSGLVFISGHCGLVGDEKSQRIDDDQALAREFTQDLEKGFETLDRRDVFSEKINDIDQYRIKDPHVLTNQLKFLGLGNTPYMEDRLVELRIPVLYVSGTRDEKYTSLAARYKKKTPFSHHRVLDSDHRVPMIAPHTLSLLIEWFDDHVVNR
jgi:pimeloyl-ACP methyl ester carboxylesterase